MRIIQFSLDKPYIAKKPIVACIGYFDGLHLGHKKLIATTILEANKQNLEPSLITFEPDPWVTIKGLKNVKHIQTMKQRINLAAKLEIKNIIILQFTKEMADLEPDDFELKVLKPLNIHSLICGFDFHYGYCGKGNIDSLKHNRFMNTIMVDCVSEDNEKISTTRITKLIEEGNIEMANRLLDYRYQVFGKVIHGHKQGRTIGFPTANIKVDDEFIMLKSGVYAGYINVRNIWYKTMINIGHNPTFNHSDALSIEAHILDFKAEIYDETIILEFDHYLRDEKCFSNKSNLALQLEQDVQNVRKSLKEHE